MMHGGSAEPFLHLDDALFLTGAIVVVGVIHHLRLVILPISPE